MKTPEKLYRSAATQKVKVGDGDVDKEMPILIQTPIMPVVTATVEGKASVDLHVKDDGFYQLLKCIDAYIVQHVYKNRDVWFKDAEVNMAMVEDAYRSSLFRGTSGQPIVRFRLNVDDGSRHIHTSVFEGHEASTLEAVEAGREVYCIVELKGLTLYKDSICPDWVVHAVKIRPQKVVKPCMFDE